MTVRMKQRWFSQIDGCYRRGYQAGLDGLTEADCPYEPSYYVRGVQSQRITAWRRGFRRAVAGKPLMDANG